MCVIFIGKLHKTVVKQRTSRGFHLTSLRVPYHFKYVYKELGLSNGFSLMELLFSSDTTPLLNGSSQDRMFETMAIEIEQLLARVSTFC